MDKFIELVRAVAVHCGLPSESVITEKSKVILPGYFRATKNWDVVVIHKGAFEIKGVSRKRKTPRAPARAAKGGR